MANSVLGFSKNLLASFSRSQSKLFKIRPLFYSSSSVKANANVEGESGREHKEVSVKTKSVSNSEALPDEAVFYHPKHNMYICWHPEVPFPYEMSKPIPTEAPLTESSLKIQSLVPVREVFRKKNERLMVRELMQMTYTPKYKWLGKFGQKKKYVWKNMDPLKERRDRKYL